MGVYLPAAKLARSMSIQLMKYLNTHRNIIINSKFNMIEMPYVFRDQYDFQLQNNIIIINTSIIFHKREDAEYLKSKISCPKKAIQFFEFWERRFVNSGTSLRNKLLKLLQNLKGINENMLLEKDMLNVKYIVFAKQALYESFAYTGDDTTNVGNKFFMNNI